ncbi:MAG: chromate resistance protein [Candidatus Brocadiales bacterium]|nr:chromate resistance protein [Candidatus Bathyanammoxibius amoris]
MYSLPVKASKERMRLWRKFRQLGAVSLKNSVYILPLTERTYENFQWLGQEIQSVGGEATLVKTNGIENLEDQDIIGLFNTARDADYRGIITACESLLKKITRGKEKTAAEGDVLNKELTPIEKKLKTLAEIDFFSAPLAKETKKLFLRCTKAVEAKRQRKHPGVLTPLRKEDFRKKRWITRKRPHVDRLATAWFIRRFIDPKANFSFQKAGDPLPGGFIPFDMVGVEFSHHGDDCTIETMLKRFGIKDPAAWEISRIVHDADLKDGKYGKEEAKAVILLLKGIMDIYDEDNILLEEGIQFFEYLYKGLKRA